MIKRKNKKKYFKKVKERKRDYFLYYKVHLSKVH